MYVCMYVCVYVCLWIRHMHMIIQIYLITLQTHLI